ncbi:class I SAM-dependent methyltransferase [Paenibacillus tengchongensis]|uniref:class I SAM-dependent methyltransferase n=1 Tax=Paenibacillus tengchongensis TaxID=2608684 RepID=UPI00124C51E4|nr:class I SAM-dependent methyltransferase [Paenibacillus tengchongensis]
MIITTGFDPTPENEARALRFAEHTGAMYVSRGRCSLNKLMKRYEGREILVVLQETVRLLVSGAEPLEFHPSMGFVRAKRILKGEPDPLIEAAGMEPGDSVLDCTAGLGSDSLLFAVYGGAGSEITALESSLPIYSLLCAGMDSYVSGLAEVDHALRRIRVMHSDHLSYLRAQPDNSVDVVYFDPMFRSPLTDSAAISPLRRFANPEALAEGSVAEALRVARKRVVLKEKAQSGEFARLGFTEQKRGSAKTSYGVIEL